MPLIDPDGMFNGDRIARLTDGAKLYWPWLYLASNGYARVEINYRRLKARVFNGFAAPPSEAHLMSMVKEYHEAYLLFLYSVRGQRWGQWDTSEKFLPKYKTASDQQSPEPPAAELRAWREAYASSKVEEVSDLSTISEKLSNISEKFPQVIVDVVGVVDGVVGDKHTCASGDALLCAPEPRFELSPKSPSKGERERWFDEEFWPVVWAKIGRGAAKKQWLAKITTPELKIRAINSAKAQTPAILQRAALCEGRVLHPATWLHQERWADEEPVLEVPISTRRNGRSAALESSLKSLENLDLSDVETIYDR
jgi:hypothetical protein